VNVDVSVTVSTRKLLKAARRARHALAGGEARSTCEWDRLEYFHAVTAWAKDARALADAGCAAVRDRLSEIEGAFPGTDLASDPFSLVPHLRQLGGAEYARSDGSEWELGGGQLYVGNLLSI